jgi:RimK family alpha-L-glutamate ligase
MAEESTTAVVACAPGKTNGALVEHWRELGLRAQLLTPSAAAADLGRGDTALVRLDVLQTLDGIEPGLDAVRELEARGVRVFNPSATLLRAHDKLETLQVLDAAGIPVPSWTHYTGEVAVPELDLPVVVKPRFGSWGRDVTRCETRDDLDQCLDRARERSWFRRHGAMIEEYLPSEGFDRRVLVAAGQVVGTVERVAAAGEWRTNVALGGSRRRAPSAPEADEIAVAATLAAGADFVGVDLIRSGGHWFVLELNGAVDFDDAYSLEGHDVFADIAEALGLLGRNVCAATPGDGEPGMRLAKR